MRLALVALLASTTVSAAPDRRSIAESQLDFLDLDAGKSTYRALFVYELTRGTWQLVQASFSLTS